MIQNTPNLLYKEHEVRVDSFIKNCIFSYIGQVAENGSMLTYMFRQVNHLKTNQFATPPTFLSPLCEPRLTNCNLIFIDDFVGTGKTVTDFWNTCVSLIKKKLPNVKIYLLALVATDEAIDVIRQHTGITLICPQILGSDYKVFDDNSSIFRNMSKRQTAKNMCQYYGEQLVGNRENALGYKGSQLLIGFHHNTPNNTLPVIWADTKIGERQWQPLFERKRKV